MNATDIANNRIFNQKIEVKTIKSAKELVSYMGAMQAQDFSMAKWAVGVRMLNSTEKQIETAYNNGEFLRTHLMRPTWHFVSSDDIYWILQLTAPRIKAFMKSSDLKLGLTENVLNMCYRLMEQKLINDSCVDRDELKQLFSAENIKTDDNALSHIMMNAELDGLICSGPLRNNKLTYALLEERVPEKKYLSKEESLAELSRRYFTSHGPATLQDFVWWSGLSITEARKAMDLIKSDFIIETIDSKRYCFRNSDTTFHGDASVLLLPAFDEFLIAYTDRSASLLLVDNRKTISDNGIFRPIIVINGQVAGIWRRTTKKDKALVELFFFQPQSVEIKAKAENEVLKYEQFINKRVELEFK